MNANASDPIKRKTTRHRRSLGTSWAAVEGIKQRDGGHRQVEVHYQYHYIIIIIIIIIEGKVSDMIETVVWVGVTSFFPKHNTALPTKALASTLSKVARIITYFWGWRFLLCSLTYFVIPRRWSGKTDMCESYHIIAFRNYHMSLWQACRYQYFIKAILNLKKSWQTSLSFPTTLPLHRPRGLT